MAAITLQGALAIGIALSGKYEQILNYVVAMDFVFFGLTGMSLFIFRRRSTAVTAHATPGHPFTTLFFICACWLVVLATYYNDPKNSFTGLGLVLLGIPVYLFWRRRSAALV